MLKKKCDINIEKTIDTARQMIKLAHTGYEQREDPNCGVLYGILLDSGYRILNLALKEQQAHIRKIVSKPAALTPDHGGMSDMPVPVVDLAACIRCEVCVDLAPHAFQINDAGYVEVLALDDYSDDAVREAVKNCPKRCITWE